MTLLIDRLKRGLSDESSLKWDPLPQNEEKIMRLKTRNKERIFSHKLIAVLQIHENRKWEKKGKLFLKKSLEERHTQTHGDLLEMFQ